MLVWKTYETFTTIEHCGFFKNTLVFTIEENKKNTENPYHLKIMNLKVKHLPTLLEAKEKAEEIAGLVMDRLEIGPHNVKVC